MNQNQITRRTLIHAGATGLAALAMPTIIASRGFAQTGTQKISLQLPYMISNNVIGHIVAEELGFFEEEGIEVEMTPGGPSLDGLAIVASGRADIGIISSSPALMMAVSQNIPVKAFATVLQQHPYVFISRADEPIKTPADMIGKKVGVNQTGVILVEALLKQNGFTLDQVEIVTIGADLSVLLTKQADVVTTWETQVATISRLGDIATMRLWDHGVQLYASVLYANENTLEQRPETAAAFLRGLNKGWTYVAQNPEKAVEIFCAAVPNADPALEEKAVPMQVQYAFNETTAANGWATFDPAVWQRQIDLYDSLQQFSAGKPALEKVMTTEILEATADSRSKIGG